MIVVITFNPAWDLTIAVDAVTDGGSHRIDPAVRRFGGKGLNVARVLAGEGYRVHAVAPAGPRPEEAEADLPRTSEFTRTLIASPAPVRSSFAIVDRARNVTNIFNERGAAQPQHVWDELLTAARSVLTAARSVLTRDGGRAVLVLSGSVPEAAPPDLLARAVQMGRQAQAYVIADTSGEHLLRAVEAGADVIKPNRAELLDAVGGDDPVAAAQSLCSAGAGEVLVSLGEEGMTLVRADGAGLSARLAQPLEGNPTGAGDAAVAALAAGHVDALDDEARLRRAVAWSASAVLMPRAGEISPEWSQLAGQVHLTARPST